jgi:hypothetical protein
MSTLYDYVQQRDLALLRQQELLREAEEFHQARRLRRSRKRFPLRLAQQLNELTSMLSARLRMRPTSVA